LDEFSGYEIETVEEDRGDAVAGAGDVFAAIGVDLSDICMSG
jgi:hypothetical protein